MKAPNPPSAKSAALSRSPGAAGCRLAALLLSACLVLAYFLFPVQEATIVDTNTGRKQLTLSGGESASWPWTPALQRPDAVALALKGFEDLGELTLEVTVKNPDGTVAASVSRTAGELKSGSVSLDAAFRVGTAYTLEAAVKGKGSVTLRGKTDGDGSFFPRLSESGLVVIFRNPVLLYFAAGLLLIGLTPVRGVKRTSLSSPVPEDAVARLLPWGAFLLIFGLCLWICLAKPNYMLTQQWGTWDEGDHATRLASMSLHEFTSFPAWFSGLITWYPGYLPLILGYDLGQLINALCQGQAPELPYRLAVITSSLIYAGMAFLAVRHAPRYKASFLLAATIPLFLFQAASMTYDTVVAGSILLSAALLLETIEARRPMTALRAVTLLALLSLGTVAKPAYSVLLLAFLLIPGECFRGRGEKWGFRVFAVCLAVWCLFALKLPGAYDNVIAGDARFEGTDAQAQLRGMLADPLGSGLKPVVYFFTHLPELASGWIDFWAYGGNGLPGITGGYLIAMLFIAPLCACGEARDGESPLTWKRRTVLALTALLAMLLLIYAQYIASSPVRGEITGVQARYFTPLWTVFLLALMWPHRVRMALRPAGGSLAVILWALTLGVGVCNTLYHLARFFGAVY